MTKEEMTQQVSDLMSELYNCGYMNGYSFGTAGVPKNKNEAYQHGLDDAWDAARKVILGEYDGGIPHDEIYRMFGVHDCHRVLIDHTASEVVSRLKEYKQRQANKIEVGDEVAWDDKEKGIVIGFDGYDIYYIYASMKIHECGRDDMLHIHKTGRHFPEIAEVLKKMQKGQDG